MLAARLVPRLALAALAGSAPAARAGFVAIPQPTAAYQAATVKFAVPNSGPAITSLTAGDLTITFSAPMTPGQAGPGSYPWGGPPFVEDTAPATLYSQQQLTRVLTFSQPLQTFGLEMIPNLSVFFPPTLTADFFSGTTLVGEVKRGVDQHSARLFAGSDPDAPFTSVRITAPSGTFGFIIGDIRAQVAPVPAPAGLVLFGVGGAVLAAARWRRGRAG